MKRGGYNKLKKGSQRRHDHGRYPKVDIVRLEGNNSGLGKCVRAVYRTEMPVHIGVHIAKMCTVGTVEECVRPSGPYTFPYTFLALID